MTLEGEISLEDCREMHMKYVMQCMTCVLQQECLPMAFLKLEVYFQYSLSIKLNKEETDI